MFFIWKKTWCKSEINCKITCKTDGPNFKIHCEIEKMERGSNLPVCNLVSAMSRNPFAPKKIGFVLKLLCYPTPHAQWNLASRNSLPLSSGGRHLVATGVL